MDKLVQDILLARVYDVAIETPLEYAQKLSLSCNAKIYLKREDLQPVHSFKLRGAYNKIIQLTDEEKERGVIAASAGNHAQGVALAANKLGISAIIVMPKTTPAIKVEAVTSYGAEVELYGDNYSEAADYCIKRQKDTNRTFIHPFDDPLVIAGQGTIGREIIEQLPAVTHIFVPVGGGGLISGIAQYIKAIKPEVRIIGVEPEDSNVMQQSLKEKKRITLSHVGIFADGVAVKQLGEQTFASATKYVDKCITVNNDQICAAIKAIFEETRVIVEPAGALAVAGVEEMSKNNIMQNAVIVAINSGANMSFERLQYIAERTLLGSGKEAMFSVTLPEKPGALHTFCTDIVNGYSITQFAYRLHKRDKANILVGIGVHDRLDIENFKNTMIQQNYTYADLSSDEIAKEHTRHMIGGPSTNAVNEHFYHIKFPERPRALTDFLAKISGEWNISTFHYRGQGGDVGLVFIGFEAQNKDVLEKALLNTGYEWECADANASIALFLR